ncbi:ectoine synthase [Plasmopara halstedii]|uniref:L-ectoine synthase n=1 Tax=Plasmopara halstedii TaxID=4781 RepID=A0A0P1AEU4_PLAHL|nr:ectoine synthase [Plasmopara halstedii]CEG39565.1 ectoine synthase [Plasmopara halstedii]|eukprot:XP_024575934.1 ectoine synthase [Plasmopara halstedii]
MMPTKVSKSLTRFLHTSAPKSFLLRSLDDVRRDNRVISSNDGALETRRYLVRNDECGFSVQHEVIQKGTPVRLEFQNHVYALLVTRGNGRVRLLDISEGPRQFQSVAEGSLVALNASEVVEIEAITDELHAVSVMNPPVFGVEKRDDATGVFPAVNPDGEALDSFDLSQVDQLFSAPESLKGGSAPMKDDPLF